MSRTSDLFDAVELIVLGEIFGAIDATKQSTKDSLPLCRHWLQICEQSHTECAVSRDQQPPTRLLELQEDGGVHLRLTSELPDSKGMKYVTLSHCWGKLSFTRLGKDTFSSFEQQVPSSALTKTFQDAISITRYLGLQYIWIDSLCIVQDDPDDWAKESSLMSNVYGGSYLNIAASGATDGSVGCFFDRSPTWVCQSKGAELFNSYLYHPDKTFLQSPLSLRAWCVQERFLPRRTLFFTDKEVFWECLTKGRYDAPHLASESYPYGLPDSRYSKLVIGKRDNPDRALWWKLVEMYSKCGITFSKDKLVAISGLAKIFHAKLNDDYLAGVWRGDLQFSLLWQVLRSEVRPAVSAYRVPSWSWAAVDGQLTSEEINNRYRMEPYGEFKIEEAAVKTKPGNPFGVVDSGYLRISTKAFPKVRVQVAKQKVRSEGWENAGMEMWFDVVLDSEHLEVYMLPIVEGTYRTVNLRGIILISVPGKKGQFKRIGMFRCGSVWEFSNALKKMPGDEDTEEVDFVVEDGKKLYRIEIV